MSRIKARLGDLEIEYDGDQEFITDGLLRFAKDFIAAVGQNDGLVRADSKIRRSTKFVLSTSSIAQKLGAKTGPDLAIAAAAHIFFVKKFEKFTHTELLAEMREAKTFYKKSFHNNLGNTLKNLVGAGRLNHLSGNDYSLSEKEIKDLEAKLA